MFTSTTVHGRPLPSTWRYTPLMEMDDHDAFILYKDGAPYHTLMRGVSPETFRTSLLKNGFYTLMPGSVAYAAAWNISSTPLEAIPYAELCAALVLIESEMHLSDNHAIGEETYYINFSTSAGGFSVEYSRLAEKLDNDYALAVSHTDADGFSAELVELATPLFLHFMQKTCPGVYKADCSFMVPRYHVINLPARTLFTSL